MTLRTVLIARIEQMSDEEVATFVAQASDLLPDLEIPPSASTDAVDTLPGMFDFTLGYPVADKDQMRAEIDRYLQSKFGTDT